jgi:hypothetical protein
METTVTFRFELVSRDGGFGVRLESEGFEPAEGPLEIDLLGDSRLAKVTARIDQNYGEMDHLADVGSQLWASLLTGPVGVRFEEICAATRDRAELYRIRLALPAEVEQLPWEALYDEKSRSFLAGHPKYCILRDPPGAIEPPAPKEREPAPLSVLVVIPEGSDLQTGRELRNLEYAVETLGEAIRLERLEGLITPVRLADKLQEGAWDVVHFEGHGRLDARGRVNIRLNDDTAAEQEHWTGGEAFASAFLDSSVQIAVLNCCLGAQPDPRRSLSGLGPALMRAGLQAVVAMRYEIQDSDALAFSRSFYGQLLNPEDPGRLDLALVKARRALYLSHRSDNARGFITPVLYLAPGFDRLPVAAVAAEASKKKVSAARVSAPAVNLPEGLLEAVREQRCVPIVGPGLLRAGAVRSGHTAPPGPMELAEKLGADSGYPIDADFQVSALAADWAEDLLLQRVCQHFQFARQPYLLIKAVRDAYRNAAPPLALEDLAALSAPGLIYTHFDGLMARAYGSLDHAVRVVNRVDEELQSEGEETLLVHLRGTVTDEASLVLTEQDHERLWNDLANLSSQVAGLIHLGLGRSILFLGVSPRDALLRRLVDRLLPEGPSRTQGPIFFVCPGHSKVDEAYWRRYGVEWIDESPDVVVRALRAQVKGEPG